MKYNKIRTLMNQSKPVLSTRMWSAWPFNTEVVGAGGNFDYVEFVAEYSPFTQYDLENIARAAELHDMGTMLKVDFQNRGYVAQKAVCAGFQGILFADHHTPEEIRETIRIMKADRCGEGRFGYPNRRYIGTQPYLTQMEHGDRLNEIVLGFMIEKAEAMERLEEICSIPGIDILQFGPSDYCMSLGKDKEDCKTACVEAEKRMIDAALRHGIAPRCEIQKPEEAEYYIGLGVRHFSLGDQLRKLQELWTDDGKMLRERTGRLERV